MSALVHAHHVSTKKRHVSESLVAVRLGAWERPLGVRSLLVVIDIVKNGTFVIALGAFMDFRSFRLDYVVLSIAMMSI